MKAIYLFVVLSLCSIIGYSQDNKPAEDGKTPPPATENAVSPSLESIPAPSDSSKVIDQEPKSFTLDANDAEVQEATVQETPVIDSSSATSQEPTTVYYGHYSSNDDIQTLAGNNHHSGGFGAISFRSGKFNDEALILTGIRGGWIINRAMAIGFEGYGIIPTAEYENIAPSLQLSSRAVGGYGGMFLEPIFFSNKVVHITFPISGGAGWIGYMTDWENSYESELIDDDVFWYLEPGASIELNVARNFRLDLGASYRFTQDLQLLSTPSTAFDGWNYFLTLKFGHF